MKRLLKVGALAALFCLALVSARADVARPREDHKKPKETNVTAQMRIEPNYKATEAKLLIPRAMLRQMSAQLDEGNASAAAASARFLKRGGAQTVMAGIFLSLAFAFGGVWLVRMRAQSGKLTNAALGLALVALLGGACAGLAYANAGPPPVARSLTSKILVPGAQPYGVYGQVKVELTDEEENYITLVLPIGKDNKEGEE